MTARLTNIHLTPTRPAARQNAKARALAGVLAVAWLAQPQPLLAQGFSWPWDAPPARPREQMNRPPQAPSPAPLPPAAIPSQAPQGGQWMQRNPICAQLEQRLTQETQRGTQSRDALPKIEADLQLASRAVQQGNQQLERADCYDYFLFSKSLRATRQCHDLAGGLEAAKRRMGDLETQRQQILGSSGRSYADDITRELARNSCGPAYQQQDASRPSSGGSSIWQDGESGGFSGGFGSSQYATYRTVCVRLCDGYYFPISFATLPNRFALDVDVCQSKCAAPVELYYHPNPGGAMEQAVSAKSQEPYTRLKSAFRYRKEYVQGCSCKEAEYVPPAGTVTVPLPVAPGTPPAGAADRRADSLPWEKTPTQR